MSYKCILRAVIKRAFDDVSLFYKNSKDKEALSTAKSALLWIQGKDRKNPRVLDDASLDEFMSFRNICRVLRLPYFEMVTYANMMAEGTHEQFHKIHPVIVWASDESRDDAHSHNIYLADRAEGFLRSQWVLSATDDHDSEVDNRKCRGFVKTRINKSNIESYVHSGKGREYINTLLSEIRESIDVQKEYVESLRVLSESVPPPSTSLTEDTGYSEKSITIRRGAVTRSSIKFPVANEVFNIIIGGVPFGVPKKQIELRADVNFPVTFYVIRTEGSSESVRSVSTAFIDKDSTLNPELYGATVSESDGIYTLTFDDTVSTIHVIPSRGTRGIMPVLNDISFNQTHFTAKEVSRFIGGSPICTRYLQDIEIENGIVTNQVPDRFIFTDGKNEYACIHKVIYLIVGTVLPVNLQSGTYSARLESLDLTNNVSTSNTEVVKEEEDAIIDETNLSEGDVIISDKLKSEIIKSGQGAKTIYHDDPKDFIFSTLNTLVLALSFLDIDPPTLVGDVKNNESKAYEELSELEDYMEEIEFVALKLSPLAVQQPFLIEIERNHSRLGYDRALDLLRSLKIEEYMSLTEEQGSYASYLADATRTLQVKVMQ